MFKKYLLNLYIFFNALIVILNAKEMTKMTKDGKNNRQKRVIFPYFPYNACYALAVALAIPLELEGRNVFLSYNFETNYYFPYFDDVMGLVPLPFATIDSPTADEGTLNLYASEEAEQRSFNNDDDKKKNKKYIKNNKKRSILETLMSRRKFYKIIETKIASAGMNGRACLLKSICEVTESNFKEHNGVLGDIVHILFTPSTTKDEKLPKAFIKAEQYGRNQQCSQTYGKLCSNSIFDYVTMEV